MCPHCKHELAAIDLLPVVSWVVQRGKCRYCQASISIQYPVVELLTAALFVVSYLWWPEPFSTSQTVVFIIWLAVLIGLVALTVYDLRWYLLPNRILYPTGVLAGLLAIVGAATSDEPVKAVLNTALAVLVGGGIFYAMFQFSKGKWIGGGDVKLGWVLGLILATPARSFLMIFLSAALGTLISLPLLATHKLKPTSKVPFGPFLIIAAFVTVLWGQAILDWYQRTFLPY